MRVATFLGALTVFFGSSVAFGFWVVFGLAVAVAFGLAVDFGLAVAVAVGDGLGVAAGTVDGLMLSWEIIFPDASVRYRSGLETTQT